MDVDRDQVVEQVHPLSLTCFWTWFLWNLSVPCVSTQHGIECLTTRGLEILIARLIGREHDRILLLWHLPRLFRNLLGSRFGIKHNTRLSIKPKVCSWR